MVKKIILSHWFAVILVLLVIAYLFQCFFIKHNVDISSHNDDSTWIAPSLYTDFSIEGKDRSMVIYGEDLIINTSKYFGPKGSISQTSNGMNCQNCHLDAGTRPWGNNYGSVASTYPKFRPRSGEIENINKRINDCFQRSLNGKTLDTNSYELLSIIKYIQWLGHEVPKGKKAYSSGLPILPFIERAADPIKGKSVFVNLCTECHGSNGEGKLDSTGKMLYYPPLWGINSFTDGAGLFRISKLATFVYFNMPYGKASNGHPVLTVEQAWDIAAFINSQPRPHFDQTKDWPDISKKAIDEPFGPYIDSFSSQQHKYGPYVSIIRKEK